MASGFYLIVFRRFSASFTGIIGRAVGFGGVGRVDSTADDNYMSSKYIYVEVTPHCSVAGLQGDIIKYLCVEFRFSSNILNTYKI
jgi:hypothetical protein